MTTNPLISQNFPHPPQADSFVDAAPKNDSKIKGACQPIFRQLGALPLGQSCVPSANYLHAIADSSLSVRNFADGMTVLFPETHRFYLPGAPLLGLTSALYGAVGVGWIKDNEQRIKICERIGDFEGAAAARIEKNENRVLVAGSVSMLGVRGFSTAKEIGSVLHHPITLSTAGTTAQATFNWASGILFSIYYFIYAGRLAKNLYDLGKGDGLRAELLQHVDPLSAYHEKLESELNQIRFLSSDQLHEIAIEEGALWLKKAAKEAKKQQRFVFWNDSEGSRKAYARELFLKNPTWMLKGLGLARIEGIAPEGEMNRVGEVIAARRLEAKLEADFTRLLGSEALAAVKNNDGVKFKKVLETTNWSTWGTKWKTVIKLILTLIGLAACITGTVLTGGALLGIVTLLYALSGLIWIGISDGGAFKEQWETGEVRRRDKWVIFSSLVLSVLAVGGLVALTVFSGGSALYLGSLILSTAWLVTNCRGVRDLVRREYHPWDYQAVPTLRTFGKLLHTEPTEEKIAQVLRRMRADDQVALQNSYKIHKNWKIATTWLEEIARKQKKSVVDALWDDLNRIVVKEPQIRPSLAV